jgi:hypothetical protein
MIEIQVKPPRTGWIEARAFMTQKEAQAQERNPTTPSLSWKAGYFLPHGIQYFWSGAQALVLAEKSGIQRKKTTC